MFLPRPFEWLDAVYPRSCLGCDEPVEGPWEYLCERCARNLEWIRPPWCHTCGHPFPGIGARQRCAHCELLDPVYDEGRCCLLHRGLAAELVREINNRNGRYLAKDIQEIARRSGGVGDLVRDSVLVPVPLHPARERERGFNQSLWLATLWGNALPVAAVSPVIVRTRWTGSQTRLDRSERMRNMRGAFTVHPAARVSPDLTYVVVDDVFTTGSTLNECCRALKRAGARRLKVLTLAHG